MSLTKLLGGRLSLFKKDAISFITVIRHDLDVTDDKLRYLAVRPNASIATLRRKVWHLLELPDFCDEVIVLKNQNNIAIPLLELRNGNSPQQPFILEVWSSMPMKSQNDYSKITNMLTMGDGASLEGVDSQPSIADTSTHDECIMKRLSQIPLKETMTLNRPEKTAYNNYLLTKKSDLTCKISTSSMFLKLQGKKPPDVTNILLKIQNDLNALTNKISNLETRIADK